MIYLDNAATTGHKPDTVVYAVQSALRQYGANPGRSGHKESLKAAMAVYKVREKAAEFFGAEGPETVVFTAGCTHSINYVLKGVLHSGDHVIVSDLEHNAVIRPLTALGVEYTAVETDLLDDRKTVARFEAAILPQTKMIFVTGASNVLGKCLPISELGELCHRKGILFGIDAAQIAGVVPINMQGQHIDFLCVAPHKGLYAPMGVGILMARKPIPYTLIEGGTGTDSANPKQPEILPERLESGTPNLPGIFGIGAGIDFIRHHGGPTVVCSEEKERFLPFCEAISNLPQMETYFLPSSGADWVPVFSCNVKGIPSSEGATWLDEWGIEVRAGLHCAPWAHRKIGTLDSGTVRFCPSVFTTRRELEQVLNVLRSKKA